MTTTKRSKYNCSSCNGIECVEKDDANIYQNQTIGLKINIPAYICSKCDTVVYAPEDYAKALEAEEAFQGRSYIKVEVKNGKVNKHSMH